MRIVSKLLDRLWCAKRGHQWLEFKHVHEPFAIGGQYPVEVARKISTLYWCYVCHKAVRPRDGRAP